MTIEQKISLIIILYVLVGFAVTGFQKEVEKLQSPRWHMVFLWPAYMLFLLGYCICVGFYKFGMFTGELTLMVIEVFKD